VACFPRGGLPSIGVEVVKIDLNTADLHAHEAETLGGQTISRVQVTLVPLLASEASPWVVGNSVESITEGNTAGSRSALRVVVSGVDVGVVVEVLLHMNNVVFLDSKSGTDEVGVGSLVTGNIVAVENVWQTSHVVGEEVELSGLLAKDTGR